MDPNTMHDTHDQEDYHQRHEYRKQVDAAITIGRRVLEEPGFVYAVSTLTKSRIRYVILLELVCCVLLA